MTSTKWIHDILSKNGYKQTPAREKIIKIITHTKGLFSTKDIIKKTQKIDRVSVYRTIDLLTSLDIIHPVTTRANEQVYELHAQTKHEHHIICNNCQKTKTIKCSIPKIILKGFHHIHHTLVLNGLCNHCAKHT